MTLSQQFLEGMNGSLFWSALMCAIIFGRYIVKSFLEMGYRRRVQAGIAIFVYILGDVIVRLYFWATRALENDGYSTAFFASNLTPSFGTCVQILGAVCIARVFSPDSWGNACVALTLLGMIGSFILAYT